MHSKIFSLSFKSREITRSTLFLILLFFFFSLYLINIFLVKSASAAQNNTAKITGKVTDVINTDSFTYLEVETNIKKVWAAGPVTPIRKGDIISFSAKMPMQNFHSKSLGRDFAVLFITNSFNQNKINSVTPSSDKKIKQRQVIKYKSNIVAGTSGEVAVGGYLREATLDGLNGKKKMFSSFKGKPLLINIWASWCGPCRAEMASLERLALRYNGKEFNVIGISTDDYRNKAIALIKQSKITFENFIDHNLFLENMLGAKNNPINSFSKC